MGDYSKIGYANYVFDSLPPRAKETTVFRFPFIALGAYAHTPFTQEDKTRYQARIFRDEKYRRAVRTVRKTMRGRPELWASVIDRRAFIAPADWPDEVRAAWGLEEPPTPYEVATAILLSPTRKFWGLTSRAETGGTGGISALRWWLMGISEEAMMHHFNVPRGTLHAKLASAIQGLMSTRRFPLWALGVNLLPLCTTRAMVRAATVLMVGRATKSSAEGGQVRDAMVKLRQHPHVKWLISTGYRINPVERTIYRPGLLWQSVEEKEDWVQGGGEAARRLKIARRTLRDRQRRKELGDWSQFK